MEMRKVIYILTFVFFAFLAFVAYWADSGTMPALIQSLYDFPYGDKVGHFVIYGIFAFLLNGAFPQKTVILFGRTFPAGALIAVSFAVVEEISQLFFPQRTFDLLDLGAGLLGILIASFISKKFIPG